MFRRRRKQEYSYLLDPRIPLLKNKKRYFFPFILPQKRPDQEPFLPPVFPRKDKPYIIRIITPSPMFFPDGLDVQKAFINYECSEFKSLVRSPQNNKNSQEQFEQVKFAYVISYAATEKRKFVRASNLLIRQGCAIISSGACHNNFHSQF